ncbi:MAG TPA: hypothetical protein DHV22_01385 [Xanthomarina gelatinilytica]|uniref:DUF6291 domain-containing protein n=1 Tax=Xanthomarina gelatinilytica TaxID=1137281 RepID=A0A3D6BM70_9FLAO|nr:hypothetical protein [Xanthomarina gelatinilytica]
MEDTKRTVESDKKKQKSFVAYYDWIETFEALSNEEAGKLAKIIFRFVNGLDTNTDDKVIKMSFIPIKQTLERDIKKWEKYIKKQQINGKKGGRPKNPTEPKRPNGFLENPTKPKKLTMLMLMLMLMLIISTTSIMSLLLMLKKETLRKD